ncbi:serine/threonine-protein kinase [Pseudonocardia sp. WMMC193]|uniref:serine/threonine-protein kinase n=1 Tax=Pseudonocardia sp. WMMC193 TaxID=2911965 RepID=UPI001F3CF274|nr:serine/threonine-protein kinase [Pseudonocardia sp. WMMC193]MCF7547394.1 serine/threonine protein kinase [Pseudonocardia sp. WMMC193]MCF7553874.1 serine/threonine protein kinase [Pseudonocardia sp. WMMC193]MCF7553903.1 serine/threonine protein kinase [Pseudonocardia sp. WMMC193]MCF7553931.1 serine/threonine protein kinase [Pseudonocardia sp. WMMC193]
MTPPEPPAPSSEGGARIGNRYRLEERIGAGAMGAVWRGTDELLNRTVAIKELIVAGAPMGHGNDAAEESRQRLLREGRIGARLQHPHVISMFDVVVHDERPWLVMEYLPSRSFAVVLGEKGPMTPKDAAAVGVQIADGLAAAHAAGVVHRDIKPGNVLIAEDGRAKITDFGVSRAVDDVQLTRTGMIAGTPAFLAPEVARGQEPTSASDVFALGATLYAAVEGEPPFGLDDNAYALLHKVATGRIRPPEHAGALTALLMRLMANEPGDRPTASQARDALSAIAAGGSAAGMVATAPVTQVAAVASPPPPEGPRTLTDLPAAPPPSTPPTRRRWVPILVGVLAVLVVGAGVLIGALRANTGQQEDPPPVAAGPTTTAAPRTTTAAPTTTTPRPTTTTPTTTPASDGAVAFVQDYYGLLPEDPDAAFVRLSPQAQAASGGISGFRNFYAGIRDVQVQNARSSGNGQVSATIVFTRADGSTSSEPYTFTVQDDLIQSFSRA